MPSINVAMERSLRRGVSDVVFASLFGKRQTIPDRVDSVKNTFSSWDACMEKTYCKWPVIAGLIVGGLILFSIVSCIVRCCCCGMSCCCSCFSFLKCCDCCGGSCDGKKNKPMKHRDDPYSHHNNGPSAGYQAPAAMPMMGGGMAAAKPAPPQYAQFEVGASGLAVTPKPQALSEDALPPMPSWDSAAKKHVETEEEKNAVELKNLDPATGQKVPLMAGGAAPGSSIPPSPNFDQKVSPYGARPGQGGNNGYMGAGGVDQYGQSQSSLSNVGYGAPLNGPNRGYASPPPQDAYGQNTNFVGAAAGGYNQRRPQRQDTGDRQYQNTGNQYQNTGGQYQNKGDQYSNTGDQYPNNIGDRQYPQAASSQYSGNSSARRVNQASGQYSGNSSARPMNEYSDLPEVYDSSQPAPRGPSRGPGPNRMASPPNNNNQGFDLGNNSNQSYSRPGMQSQQQPSYNSGGSQATGGNGSYYNGSTAAPSYASRSPPPQDAAYNDYPSPAQSQPYPNNNRGPPSSRPGPGARGDPRRQPQGWDPVNNH